jgi:hypothetical protein
MSVTIAQPNLMSSFAVPGPARTAEIDFLTTGQFPNATNQTLVTIYGPGSKKVPIPDPYTAPIGSLAGDFTRKMMNSTWSFKC